MDARVEAATQAWLAKLPAAERLAAQAHTDARLLVWLGAGAVVALTSLAVTRSGLISRLRRRLEGDRPRPWLVSAASAAGLALALGLVLGLYDAATGAWEARILGEPPQLAARLGEAIAGLPAIAAAAAVAGSLLMRLARWRPRAWPWIAGLAFTIACLGLGWGPYALGGGAHLELAPPNAVQQGLLRLAADAGLPAHQIYLSPDPRFDADVTGAFGRATVVVGAATLAWPPAEARAYVGHLMGHHAHGDVFAVYLIWGLTGLAAFLGAAAWGAPLARLLGAGGAAGPGDPEALPAVVMVFTAAMALGTLAACGYLRWANVRADAYSLAFAREPAGLAAAIEREWDHEAVDPGPLETAIFYSHPPLEPRLRQAMAWKVAHGG